MAKGQNAAHTATRVTTGDHTEIQQFPAIAKAVKDLADYATKNLADEFRNHKPMPDGETLALAQDASTNPDKARASFESELSKSALGVELAVAHSALVSIVHPTAAAASLPKTASSVAPETISEIVETMRDMAAVAFKKGEDTTELARRAANPDDKSILEDMKKSLFDSPEAIELIRELPQAKSIVESSNTLIAARR